MSFKKHVLFLFLLSVLNIYYGQELEGFVFDETTKEALIGVKISSSEGQKTITNNQGKFVINYQKLPLSIRFNLIEYTVDSVFVMDNVFINFALKTSILETETVVVSTSRRKQNVEDATISLEILKARLIENKGISDLEQAVDQSPGVFAMDGQVSIRGGSGFSYGAGSRVLLLWNGIPMVSGDAGDVKWNTIPLESVSQIEIIKGASSVLYGSGALNGIIALQENEPSTKLVTSIKIQNGIYGKPKRESLQWWSKNPTFQQVDFFSSKMNKKVGYTFSFAGFKNKGFRQGETEDRIRTGGSVFFRFEKIKNLKAGIGYSIQVQKTGNFIIWQSDSLGYQPSGGADTSNTNSSLTYNRGVRLNIDPYIKYIDKKANIHNFRTRFYLIDNLNYTNKSQNSISLVNYLDYQFQKSWQNTLTLTSGISYQNNQVKSTLFGDHHSNNFSLYSQVEKKYNKLFLTGGIRLEYFEQDSNRGDSDYFFGKDSVKIPLFPIIRLAGNYQLAKYTKIRISFGQGVRYPSIAERYTQTSVGSLNIFPNRDLKREVGWASEIGIKQGVKIGKLKGLLDVSAFVNQYENMMEFAFGFYLPDSISPSLNPNDVGYMPKWFGFQAQNAEKARITGLEFSFNCEGKIKNVEINSLIGYTYMHPISLNTDSSYLKSFSNPNSTLLKYRFRHLAKADVEAKWKKISLGISFRYASFMENIDYIFENPFLGIEVLPGLKNYRIQNNKGIPVFDIRIGYEIKENFRLGLMLNNFLNAEYTSRPGDIQAPRTFLMQVQIKF
jgi:outer membrane cobalamin receptor